MIQGRGIAAQDRIHEPWLDVTKGIGIVLVVVGHLTAGPLQGAIYLFHMPLFFMLAGYLMKPTPWLPFAANRVRTLLVPYACYLIAISALGLWRFPRETIATDLYGGRHLGPTLSVFWFVTCLFLAQLVFAGLLRLSSRLVVAALVFVLAAIGYATAPLDLPWNAGVVPAAVFFLWAGHSLKTAGFSRPVVVAALVLGLSAVLAWPALSSRERWPHWELNLSEGVIGYPVYGLLLAVGLAILLMLVARRLARWPLGRRALASIGTASITIMFLHQLVHVRLERWGLPWTVQFIAALALPYAFHQVCVRVPVLRRLLLGGRRLPPQPIARARPDAPPLQAPGLDVGRSGGPGL